MTKQELDAYSCIQSCLSPDSEFVTNDVRKKESAKEVLKYVSQVCLRASSVGAGQSMYEISRHTYVNNRGNRVFPEALAEKPSGKRVAASGTSMYGEGS